MHAITLGEVLQPYLHLPGVIQTALLRVETHPTFRSVTRSALRVLKALVTRCSATNGTTMIRARLDTVALQAGVSTKTTQRAMRQFDAYGWIKAMTEGRSEYGVFCSKRYAFSDAFCALVHLPTKERPAETLAQETQMSDGGVYADLSLKKDQQEISIKNRGTTPIILPEEVRAMPGETGIKDSGICLLQSIAKAAGHKLADVYTIAKPYFAANNAKGNRAFCYLRSMLGKQVDYHAKVLQLTRVGDSKPAAANTDSMAGRCRFKKFVSKDGAIVRFFDGTAEVRRDIRSAIVAGEQLATLYADVASGKLREVLE